MPSAPPPLLAAALVPDTALIVPGVAGRGPGLADLRAAALDAVAAVLGDAPGARPTAVVVVAPGAADRRRPAPGRVTLAAAGVPDGALRWRLPDPGPAAVGTGAPDDVGVPAAVALLLLDQVGWHGPTSVVEVARPGDAPVPRGRAAELAAIGAELVRTAGATDGAPGAPGVALVVVGSLSARHGPHGPLADDDRAPAQDEAVVRGLTRGGPGASAALAALPGDLAAELAVSGWGPWQVLLGAVAEAASGDEPFPGVETRVHRAEVAFGAQHVVATLRLRPPAPPEDGR
ncbi:hypothetical protein AGMMS50218_06470 [Actinomycetota bacterium]|nr:hypothetical protein AGMMS50218_06470 [Actinomycetota bacterium]